MAEHSVVEHKHPSTRLFPLTLVAFMSCVEPHQEHISNKLGSGVLLWQTISL